MSEYVEIYGHLRSYTTKKRPRDYETRKAVFDRITKGDTVKHGIGDNFFDFDSGGFYITYKGHNKDVSEKEAAKIMAKNGFEVRLTSEEDQSISVKNGKFRDGKIASIWYEQYSPKEDTKNKILNALIHANDKGADIPILYVQTQNFGEAEIKKAYVDYRNGRGGKTYGDRKKFNEMLVVDKETGKVYSWLFKNKDHNA